MKQCLICLGLFSNAVLAGSHEPYEPVVYIDQEPSHRVVLHNDVLRIFDVAIEPGASSLFHLHDKDSVLACLDGADVPSEEPGKPIIQRPPIRSGQTYYRAYSQTPFVHRIQNVSANRFRILDIEILSEPAARGALPIELAPMQYSGTVALENDRVRVSAFALSPNQEVSALTFRGPHLFVFMSGGKVGIESTETTVTAIDVQRGRFHYVAQARSESVHNFGSEAIDMLVLEVKHQPQK